MKTAFDVALSHLPRAYALFPDRQDTILPIIESAFWPFDNQFGLSATFTPYREDGPWGYDLFHGRTLVAHAAPWHGEVSWGTINPRTIQMEWVYHRCRPEDFTDEFGKTMSYVIARLQQRGPKW